MRAIGVGRCSSTCGLGLVSETVVVFKIASGQMLSKLAFFKMGLPSIKPPGVISLPVFIHPRDPRVLRQLLV